MIGTVLRGLAVSLIGAVCMLYDTVRPHRTTSPFLAFRCNRCRRIVPTDRVYSEGALGLRHFRRGQGVARPCGPLVPTTRCAPELRVVAGRWS